MFDLVDSCHFDLARFRAEMTELTRSDCNSTSTADPILSAIPH
jgi:hypothetical protein